ncbi:GPI ethanolamine phosphate transferase 1 [Physcia stellaris]|nr:GPI ethanolamine phosphate transferase 1 [Physcia stellaris]
MPLSRQNIVNLAGHAERSSAKEGEGCEEKIPTLRLKGTRRARGTVNIRYVQRQPDANWETKKDKWHMSMESPEDKSIQELDTMENEYQARKRHRLKSADAQQYLAKSETQMRKAAVQLSQQPEHSDAIPNDWGAGHCSNKQEYQDSGIDHSSTLRITRYNIDGIAQERQIRPWKSTEGSQHSSETNTSTCADTDRRLSNPAQSTERPLTREYVNPNDSAKNLESQSIRHKTRHDRHTLLRLDQVVGGCGSRDVSRGEVLRERDLDAQAEDDELEVKATHNLTQHPKLDGDGASRSDHELSGKNGLTQHHRRSLARKVQGPIATAQESRPGDRNDCFSDFELLRQVVLKKSRHGNTRGLKQIWREIQRRKIELPTKGATADQLWGYFVEMGLSHGMILSVIQYAVDLQQKTKSHWENLYLNIILLELARNSPGTLQMHNRLYKTFPPTAGQFMSLFNMIHRKSNRSPDRMEKLQLIYMDLPFSDLYAKIMLRLYQNEDFEGAASWHNVLITKRDIPTDLHLYRPLFRYMVLYGDRTLLATMVKTTVKASVPLPSFIKHPLPIDAGSQELIDQRLAEIHGITPSAISDELCARLFATSCFSIGSVVKLLRIVGVDCINAQSLKEIVVRVNASPKSVRASIAEIETAGLTLDSSTYCSIVKKLATEDDAQLLKNVAQCDLHPETFDDKPLQESLLFNYYASGDQLQVNRTLAILTAKHADRSHPIVYWNLYLRLHLKRKDIQAVDRTLKVMHSSGIPIESTSSSYVRICLLTRRSIGKRPHYIHDLPIITNIWQNVLRSGGVVPCIAWIEILRRLGMTGQLEEYEKLALWLAKYYSGSSAGPSLGLLPSHQVMSKWTTRRLINVPSRMNPDESRHPLFVLFPPRVQQAIVAWGFQHSRIGGLDWRWGLQLLLKLKLFRVSVERPVVAKACKLRLGVLFGSGLPRKLINSKTKAQNAHMLGHYIREMEKIGGTSLLFGREGPETIEAKINILLEEFFRRENRSPHGIHALTGAAGLANRHLRLDPVSQNPIQ